MAELVVGVDNPETCRIDVRVEEGVRHPREDSQVVLNCIVHFHSILKEESEPLDVVCNIVLNSGI